MSSFRGVTDVPLRPPLQISVSATTADDPRIGQFMGRDLGTCTLPRVGLIGFPCDEGVRRNHGRPGAAAAPNAIRRALYGLTLGTADTLSALVGRMSDLGDLEVTRNLERDQAMLGEVVGALIQQGTIPIVLGGGHETSYGHFLGYVAATRDVSIVNWDAHPDVRPLIDGRGHSGSPFRQALLHDARRCRRYTVAGLLPHAVSRAHIDFIAENGGDIVWREAVCVESVSRLYAERTCATMVSFDLDAVDAAHAPGVSAPSAGGLLPAEWFPAALEAGRCEAVTSLDIVELNPSYDVDQRTATLAALTLWYFLRGVSERRTNY